MATVPMCRLINLMFQQARHFLLGDCYCAWTKWYQSVEQNGIQSTLQRAKIHERTKFFLQHILVRALPIQSRMTIILGIGDSLCLLYNKKEENEFYIFKECEIINLIALNAQEVGSIRELLFLYLKPPTKYKFELEKERFTTMVANLFYLVQNIRNDQVHS